MAKPKILLLDPDLKSRNILEISLKKAGFTVTSGESAADALDVVDTFDPNLILSEIALRDRDGFWLVEQLRIKHGHLKPMIFLTRQNRVEEKVKALDLGVEDYLVKPIYLREVLVRVRRLLEKQESQSPATAREDKPAGNMFQGVLGDMSVVDILQTMEFGNKTAIIHVSTPKRDAQIFIQDGRPVHAVAGSLVGERAVYKMLQWTEGNFRIDFRKSLQVQNTINTSTQGLIMEGVRRLDEIERLKEQLPPFTARLVIDSQIILEEHPDRFPAKIENIMAEFDSHKDVEAVVESLPYDDLESLEVISKLYFQGFLVEAPTQSEPAKAPEPKSERSTFTATGGVLDLERLELGNAASVENIKRKAKASQDDNTSGSQSSGRSARPAPVFDSLPGFSLAPPSDRIVKASDKQKVGEAARKMESESNSAAKFKEASSFRIGSDAAPPVDMAPPMVPPPAAPPAATVAPEPLRPAASAEPDKPRVVLKPAPNQFTAVEPDVAVIGNVITMPARREPVVEKNQAPKVPPAAPTPPETPARQVPTHSFEDTMLSEPAPVAPAPVAVAKVAPVSPKTRLWLVAGVLVFGLVVGLGAWKWMHRGGRNAQEFYDQALIEFEAHELDEAASLIERSLQLKPSHTPSRVLSADIEAARGNVQQALNQYNTVISTDPSLFDVRLRYAQLLYNQRQVPMAERALSECRRLEIDLSPMRDRALYVATLVLESDVVLFLERPKDARAPIARLEEIDPGNEQLPRLKMATERLRELQAEEAEATDQVPAPVISPTAPPVAEVVPVPAPKAVDKPAPAAPSRKPSAPKVAEAPEASDPKLEEAEALHRKGLDLYRKGHLKNSERALQSALELAPNRDEVMIDLGRVYSELGQDRVALKYFLKAAQVAPKNPRVYVNLGSIYMLMGNRADAVKAYQTFVKLAPADDSEAREVRKILEKLSQ